MTELIKLLALFVLISLALIFDIKSRKIPNRLTVSLALFGLGFQLIMNFPTGVVEGLAGLIVGFAIFLVPYLMKGMGAGDVKLMAAIGAITNWRFVIYVAISTALAGGIIAVFSRSSGGGIYMTFNRTGRLLLFYWFSLVHRFSGLPTHYMKMEKYQLKMSNQRTDYIPYALAIFIGCIITLGITWMNLVSGLSL